MKLLIYRETRQSVSTSKMRQKNTPERATFYNPLVKTNQLVSQQTKHWNWLKCQNIATAF